MARLFDEAMSVVGGGDWVYAYPLPDPVVEMKTIDSIANPISVDSFVGAVLRPSAGVNTACSASQVMRRVLECGSAASIGQAIAQRKYTSLPLPIGIPGGTTMPPDATMDVLIVNHHDGTADII